MTDRQLLVRDRNLRKLNETERGGFRICRRVALTDPLKVNPEFDKIDRCSGCGVEVYFDFRDSEGKVHVCVHCAKTAYDQGSPMARALKPFVDMHNVTPDNLGDAEQFSQMMMSVSQAKHNEHKLVLPEAPRHEGVERI